MREDELEARLHGVGGVPFFVFGGRYAVSGAQPPGVLRGALDKAWAQAAARASKLEAFVEGAVCRPDGCR